jgi:hypothetical protein
MNKFTLYFGLILLIVSIATTHAQQTVFDKANELGLTDQEKDTAENYLHSGLEQDAYMEKCVNEDKSIKTECLNTEQAFDEDSTLGGIERMMPVVQQAYSMFALIPGANQIKYIQKAKKPGDPKPADKSGTDYCGYIPAGVEMAATTMAQIKNQSIEANITDPNTPLQSKQAESFYSMASVQENLAKTSNVQAYGWGATAACYTSLMAFSVIVPNTGAIVKASASTLLTIFYGKKVKAHKERAAAYKKLGDEFPKAGECNPFSNTSCFCLEPTSKVSDPVNFQKYCVPNQFHSDATNAVSCVTKDFKADPICSCKSRGTCMQAKLASVGYNLGLEPTAMNNILKAVKPFSTGFSNGSLEGITSKNLAYAKRQLEKIKPTKVAFKNKKEKDLAKELIKLGVPKFGAAKLATTQGTNGLPASFNNSFGKSYRVRPPVSKNPSKSNKAQYAEGGSARRTYKKSSSRFKRSSRGGSGSSAIEIEDFASRAEKSAMNNMISKDKSRPIFEIITYRYKTSAWREFKDQMAIELKEEPKTGSP